MTMQQIGQAQPVLLLQTDGMPNRSSFSSDRDYVKFLRKMLKEAKGEQAKKKDEKKSRAFSYWEMASILIALSVPLASIEIGLGYACFKIVRVLAGAN